MNNPKHKEWLLSLFAPGWKNGGEQRYEEAIINCINLNGTLFDRKTHEVCFRCRGKGYQEIACGPYDYDEHDCELCEGKGCIKHNAYKRMYKDFIAKTKAQSEEKERIKIELEYIKSKLTPKELEFLLKYLRCSYS